MTDTTDATARDTVLEAAARIWAEDLAAQCSRTPEAAARAAGCKTTAEVDAWVAEHRPTVTSDAAA